MSQPAPTGHGWPDLSEIVVDELAEPLDADAAEGDVPPDTEEG